MRRIAIAALAGAVAAAFVIFGAGEALSRPAARLVGDPPMGMRAMSLRLPVPEGQHVSGWFARGRAGAGAVLLLHGVRADRTQMIERARFLATAGYSVLLIDLPAHGESSGDR